MKRQNFQNHSKIVIGFHGFTFLAIMALVIGSIMALAKSSNDTFYTSSLLVLNSFILLLLAFYLRSFSLKAQDRAIRAEEKLRYFILTGKAMSNFLSTRQIIGLRFASDEEFVDLAHKAEKEGLSEKEIKQAIQNWKADTYRV
ncbi:hypothetical protein SAMN06265371_104394 [Lutibacter agarilyticus]|uniref:Uncharacterized protein n=1 Tax=Lutibacter agarilyticus TaxID=1109740 RepID=A0A238X3Y7_9FLAO|nr:DUF6526 family protein [Lutibacter agarilyticus]SNR53647.1 hypothetical protein SAMN06265371_104394 [Lutibacter agarilyticus]